MEPNATIPEADSGSKLPEKYIRTFAGDIQIVQKGGVPDLAPLEQKIPTPVPAEVPVREPVPQERIVVAPAPQPPQLKVSPLKTYASDFSDRLKETHASTATVLAAEQDRTPVASQPTERLSRSSMLYISAGVVLLIAGGAGAYFAYTRFLAKEAPVIPVQAVSAPIFVDERKEISGTGTALLQEIKQSVTASLAPNAVRLLYTTTATTTDNSVFSALQLPAPGALVRNINAAGSMAGVVSAGGGVQSPFFILSVSSYSTTFAGMLSWEKTMSHDLAGLFPPYPEITPETNATSTVATTTVKTAVTNATTTPPRPVVIAGFFDTTVANHDARVYRDTTNRTILIYGYWNQMTLVIARNETAFTEILGRLATSRTP